MHGPSALELAYAAVNQQVYTLAPIARSAGIGHIDTCYSTIGLPRSTLMYIVPPDLWQHSWPLFPSRRRVAARLGQQPAAGAAASAGIAAAAGCSGRVAVHLEPGWRSCAAAGEGHLDDRHFG